MARLFPGCLLCKSVVLAPLIVLVLPAGLQAAWLGFRNDVKVPLIVRANIVVNNTIRAGKPYVVYPGEISWDAVLQPGNRVIEIRDAKNPKRILFQDTITINKDAFYSIQLDPPNNLKLVPAKMPKPPKANP
jgi:hypothetical protein